MARFDVSRLTSSGTDSLPRDHIELTARRLAMAATLTGCIYLVYIVLYQTLWVAQRSPVGLSAGVAGLVVSALTAGYLFSGARRRKYVIAIGATFEVSIAFALAVSDASTLRYDAPSSLVTWGAVLIALFPFLMPAAPHIVLAVALAAAAMTPIGMAVVFATTARSWPEAAVSVSVILPPVLCAFLAWVPARAIQRLGKAVQAARQLGSYELFERLGAGGMGEVYRARHRLLARPAAVKLVSPERLGAKDDASRQVMLTRFEKEARVTASLDSPHTVELYDFGASASGELFIVMELLEGVDTQTLVERFGPLPGERVAYLLMQACDSLEDAHRRGLIHRDIKPANLFIARKGIEFDFLKVLDFGLVKRWQGVDEANLGLSLASVTDVGQTLAGQIVGTPAYIAPEAALGGDALDHRVDIYSLGCVAYWWLTGSMVFDDSNPLEMVVSHVTRPPMPPSERDSGRPIARELERIILACLSKDREQRPASARQLRELLSKVAFDAPWSRERGAGWWQENLAELTQRPNAQRASGAAPSP